MSARRKPVLDVADLPVPYKLTAKARAELGHEPDGYRVGDVVYLRLSLVGRFDRVLVDPRAGLGVVDTLPGVVCVNAALVRPELRARFPRGWPVGLTWVTRSTPEEQRRQELERMSWVVGALGAGG